MKMIKNIKGFFSDPKQYRILLFENKLAGSQQAHRKRANFAGSELFIVTYFYCVSKTINLLQ